MASRKSRREVRRAGNEMGARTQSGVARRVGSHRSKWVRRELPDAAFATKGLPHVRRTVVHAEGLLLVFPDVHVSTVCKNIFQRHTTRH
ncbi:unnamed protein product [Amoebophrya sp. A120]|nr:unnamed protein product [Amoebophrya sp. A120]|eukprot:GSA120T00001849001.1